MTTPQAPQPYPSQAPAPWGQPSSGYPPAYAPPYGYGQIPPMYTYVPPVAPPEQPPRGGRWFVPIFGVLMLLATVGAVALAAYAPSSIAPLGAPSGWSQVYNKSLSQAGGDWDVTGGCAIDSGGLYASTGDTCAFVPTQQHDLTSGGFLFSVTVAPAGDVPLDQEAAIGIGDELWMCVDQLGTFILSPDICDVPLTQGNDQSQAVTGEVPSLHTDPLLPNTLSVLYDASASTITYAANGQPFETITVNSNGGAPHLSLGTGQDGAALFTAATLYSANGGQ